MSVPRSTSLEHGLVWLVALILALGAMVPLASRMPVRAASPDLFFSEYIEGSSNNKAIEIYNGTGAAVNLGAYTLELYSNGTSTVTQTLAPSGTIADGDVYVIAHTLANSLIQAQADLLTAAIVNFNGNDAVVLKHSGVAIDMFGTVGNDPGTAGWGTDPVTTTNHTLTRKPTVQQGDANGFTDPATEWDGHPQDTSSFLGSHTVSDEPLPTNPTGIGVASPASVNVGASTVLTVAVTPGANPTSSGVTVTADLGPIGGSAAQAFADDGTTGGDATAGDLVFTYTATVGNVAVGDKVITATIEDAEDRSNTALINLTVAGAPSQIADIQGTSHRSPMTGDDVFGVEGIVTATVGNGFWMTDPTPDADTATSDGIFVFTGTTPTVAVGDGVVVSGTVVEFRPGGSGGTNNLTTTELSSPTVDVVSEENALPTTVIGVDRFPPTTVIDDDSTTSVEASNAVYDPANDGIDFWESLEGMRLEVRDAIAVGPTNGFGETAAVSQLQSGAGVRTPRGGILVRQVGPAGDYRPGDFNPERVILDDRLVRYARVNTGDEFASDPVGVLDYDFGNFKLLVTEDPGRDDNGLVREVAAAAGSQELKVATFNVENLSTADSAAKVEGLAAQIVTNLRSPDLIAIEEMQDNNGTTNNGVVAADQSWQRLIAAIVAAGGPTYQYRQIDPVNNADGGAPGGNIRVGFLFRTDRGLEFVDRPGGTASTDTNVVGTPNSKGARLTISPGRVLPDPAGPWANAFFATRKSLAGEFRWRGETVFVVVNHFSSKGDDRPLFGRFQPPFRLTEFESVTNGVEDGWRHAQAQVVNDFVDEILAVDPAANVIVLGDVNDFDFSETVGVLSGTRVAQDPGPGMPDADGSGQTAAIAAAPVLRTLFERLPANERYSYVFDGNSQVLDQILVSGSLWNLGTTYDVVHVNAEFFDQASDHDPSVMTVAFQPRNSSQPSGQLSSGSPSSRGTPKGG